MAQYIKQEMPDLHNKGRNKCFYRIASRGNITQDQMIKEMCRHTGLNHGNVRAVFTLMAETMHDYLAKGYSVTLDEIGNFSLSLGLKQGKDEEDLNSDEPKHNARSIHVTGVNFRVNKRFLRGIDQDCKLERTGISRLNRSPYTKEQRLLMAVDYIQQHTFMRIDDYVSLTKLPKSTASHELREYAFTDNSPIKQSGRGSSLVYVKR